MSTESQESRWDAGYWEHRYQTGATQWDVGYATPPITEYFEQITNKEARILVPGAGLGWEVAELWRSGFKNTWYLDLAGAPAEAFIKRLPEFPQKQILLEDFFSHQHQYDFIFEQTFFCSLEPAQRPAYAAKMHELLQPGGKLVGVLFNEPLNSDHPPFGGNSEEYRKIFSPYFNFKHFDDCYNSIKPRAGREIFMVLERKSI